MMDSAAGLMAVTILLEFRMTKPSPNEEKISSHLGRMTGCLSLRRKKCLIAYFLGNNMVRQDSAREKLIDSLGWPVLSFSL